MCISREIEIAAETAVSYIYNRERKREVIYYVYIILTWIADGWMSLDVVRVVEMSRCEDALPVEAEDTGGYETGGGQNQADHHHREPGALHPQDRRRLCVCESWREREASSFRPRILLRYTANLIIIRA